MESIDFNSELRTIRIELEAIKSGLELNLAKVEDVFHTHMLQKGLTTTVINSISGLLSSIADRRSEPLTIFQKAFGFLNEIEQIAFIANNVMEELKKGKAPSNIYQTYTNLGLIEKPAEHGDNQPSFEKELTEFWFNLNYKTLKSLGTLGTRLASKSLKALPEFAKIKVHFSPVPPFISLSCEMENSTGLDKVLEIVQDSLKETNIILAKK